MFNGDEAQFTMPSLSINFAECVVTTSAVDGYSDEFTPGGGSAGTGGSSNCTFDGMEHGDENTCSVVYTADDVRFEVWKLWDITRVGGEFVNPSYSITLTCNSEITLGDTGGTSGTANSCEDNGNGSATSWWCTWDEVGTDDVHVYVDADATGSTAPVCSASESIGDSAVESDDNCGARSIAVDSSSSCTINNTIFFEGIPTLNQYGLAILALLMLGVGFVGFRRFV